MLLESKFEVNVIGINTVKKAKEKGQLSISHRRVVIKLIEQKIEIKGTLKIGDQYHYLTLIQKLYQKLSPQS